MFSCLTPASRFLGRPLHAADYFIDILNTDIFRKHSASDSPGSVFHILLHFLCRALRGCGWLSSWQAARQREGAGAGGTERGPGPGGTPTAEMEQEEPPGSRLWVAWLRLINWSPLKRLQFSLLELCNNLVILWRSIIFFFLKEPLWCQTGLCKNCNKMYFILLVIKNI